jgi:hypothetical protein
MILIVLPNVRWGFSREVVIAMQCRVMMLVPRVLPENAPRRIAVLNIREA